jgi:hypothetical protein
MEVLYQLSYVGASPNPSVVAADRDMFGAPNDQKCLVVPGAFSWGVLGRFRGKSVPSPVPHSLPGT